MKKSVFFRNFIVTTCMFVVCFLVFGVTMFLMGRAFLARERQANLYATAGEVKQLAEAVRSGNGELNSWELRINLSTLAEATGNHIFLCDGEGVVVSSSDRDKVSPYIGRLLPTGVMTQLARDGSYEALTDLGGFYGGMYYVVAMPISRSGGETEGYVFVSYAGSGLFGVWSGFLLMFVLIAAGVLALAIAFEYANDRRLARPLNEMAEAAHRFARGDYSARISPYDEDDEIGTLTQAFNAMADSLERNESRRQEFIANVSHELRTPMTSIAGFADGILDGTIPPEEEKKYLQTISSETKRLGRLVRTMLDAARLRDADPERRRQTFDLGEMVLQTMLNFEDRVDAKGLSVALRMPEEALRVMGDIDELTRVVYNLIDNAIKFAREGTELAVSVWKENGKAYTSVQNTGQTIPPEELPLIFDRFHKADRSRSRDREGAGLGLYMVRQILSAHDQDIFVTSEDSVTVFTFTLALAE